ncbi:hypothetical protein POTOM_003257 [Populus tomentosa]|uniref:Disease resistance protein At4g27190-like leucine-rich repeats domain-containing protein n=1 Tax=Populus tomentosa TaxID=118781 RepID=A0A8X8DL61_POPTO|nr:hypothetical protein POTOM_003257 [Populus tomentosa]
MQGLTNLETLRLDSMHDMRCIWKGLVLSKLTMLKVVKCKRLTHVFTCNIIVSLVQLKVLKILSCEELEQIIAKDDDENNQILLGDHHPSLRFPNLSHIEIRECNTLKSLFPLAMALSLPNLQILIVREASRLVGVFGQEKNALPVNVEKVMELPHLQVFECPKMITRFATTPNGSIRAQSEQNGFLQRLEYVHLDDCGDVRAPFPAKLLQALKNLDSVKIKDCKSLEEVFELGEADEGSSEEKEMPLLSSLKRLKLSKLPELKCIWKGPTGHVSLRSLARLYLDSLDKLAFIFTPSLAQSLPKLERLRISDCGELKHIIREEDGEREIIPESPGQDDQASPVNVEKEVVLPNLKELSLEQLSSIVCFSFGWCDYFLFPRLEKLKVDQCPKLTTKFATTRDGSMSAQSEVSEVAEDSSINREWTRNNGWKEDGDSCL